MASIDDTDVEPDDDGAVDIDDDETNFDDSDSDTNDSDDDIIEFGNDTSDESTSGVPANLAYTAGNSYTDDDELDTTDSDDDDDSDDSDDSDEDDSDEDDSDDSDDEDDSDDSDDTNSANGAPYYDTDPDDIPFDGELNGDGASNDNSRSSGSADSEDDSNDSSDSDDGDGGSQLDLDELANLVNSDDDSDDSDDSDNDSDDSYDVDSDDLSDDFDMTGESDSDESSDSVTQDTDGETDSDESSDSDTSDVNEDEENTNGTPQSEFSSLPDTDEDDGSSPADEVAAAVNGQDTSATDNIESYMTEQSGGYSLTNQDISVDDIMVPSFMKQARAKTYMGLVKSVSELGVLTPIAVTYTDEYAKFLKESPDTPYTGIRYVLLDGYRRLFALYRNGIDMVRATIFEFGNAEQAMEMALLFKCVLNKYTPSDIEEDNSIADMLQKQYSVSQDTIEYLLSLHSGDYMKLKDIVNSSGKYPEIMDDLFNHKKTLDQAFNALQKARKKEDQLRIDDVSGISGIKEAEGVVDGEDDQPLSEEETLDILSKADDDMSSVFTEGVSDGDISMAPEDYGAQKVHERHPLDPAIKQAVMIRDNFHCVVCGKGAPVWLGALIVHHPVPVYGGGTDKFESPVFLKKEDGRIRLNPANNLVTLCDACHEALHTIAFKHRGKLPMSADYYNSLSPEEQESMKRLKLLISVEAAIDKKLNRNQHELAKVKHRMPGEGYEEVLSAYNSSDPSPLSNVIGSDDADTDTAADNVDTDTGADNDDTDETDIDDGTDE